MKQILLVIAIFAVGAIAGYYYAWSLPYDRRFPIAEFPILFGNDLACRSPAYAGIFDIPFQKSAAVQILASRGTDRAAIHVDKAKRELEFVTGSNIELGRTKGDTFKIISSSDDTLTAVQILEGEIHALILNSKTGRAIWTKATAKGLLMMSGQAVMFQCQ